MTLTEPTSYQRAVLLGLQGRPGAREKHVYGGTVSGGVIAKRRAKNRAGRRSRRLNRH